MDARGVGASAGGRLGWIVASNEPARGGVFFGKLVASFASAWFHLKEVGGFRDPSELTVEDFRLELADLGLLGQPFGPEEYRTALEERLGIEIAVEEVPDAEGGVYVGELIAEGHLAEVAVEEESGNAIILVRESLRYRPWPAHELGLFHELSHLAAGHTIRVKHAREDGTRRKFRVLGSRLARREPPKDGDAPGPLRELLETEARKRAKWLVLAGTCPEVFEADKVDRLT